MTAAIHTAKICPLKDPPGKADLWNETSSRALNAMISIKRFLDQCRTGPDDNQLLEAAVQTGRLLLDAIVTNSVRGRDCDFRSFARMVKDLQRKMGEPPTALGLLEIAGEAAEAMEAYARQTTEFIQTQNSQMHEMLAMLTDTVAEISGQTDDSIARLQSIEYQIERASSLDDMRALSTSLQSCLAEVREAAAQQKNQSGRTTERLRQEIDAARNGLAAEASLARFGEMDPEPEMFAGEPDTVITSYIGVFKLQRADHVASRFGDQAKHQLLALISQNLKAVLGPKDRLLRWKGNAFVMFLESSASIHEVRAMLTEAVAATGQQYIKVGKKSALLSVGVDWTVFPQAQFASLDAVFSEVDSFLAGKTAGHVWRGEAVS